jgi:TPR repeat protein
LYDKGHGVPQDYAEAYLWFDLAAAGKLSARLAERTVNDRHKAASHLTPADQSRVQQRVRKSFEEHQAKPQ